MKIKIRPLKAAILSGLASAVIGLPVALAAAPCSPCAPRASRRNPCNPCAAKGRNPCAAKNPCAAANPCAAGGRIDPKLVTRPKGTKPFRGNRQALVQEGEKLWNDTHLSTNNFSCQSCHRGNAMFQPSFVKPYPHRVQMAMDNAGLAKITLEEMVQFCMLKPMAAKPLPWDSRELAALTAYTAKVQKQFKLVGGANNPCAARNPCAAKNPCAPRNPCAAKNPCAAR